MLVLSVILLARIFPIYRRIKEYQVPGLYSRNRKLLISSGLALKEVFKTF